MQLVRMWPEKLQGGVLRTPGFESPVSRCYLIISHPICQIRLVYILPLSRHSPLQEAVERVEMAVVVLVARLHYVGCRVLFAVMMVLPDDGPLHQ